MPEESFNRMDGMVDGPRQRKQAVRMNVADNGTGVKTYDEDAPVTFDDSDSDASQDEEDAQLTWSKAEFNRVLNATLGFGVNRWEEVRQQAVRPLTRHTKEEVEAVGNLMVSAIQDGGRQIEWIHEEGTSVYISPAGMKVGACACSLLSLKLRVLKLWCCSFTRRVTLLMLGGVLHGNYAHQKLPHLCAMRTLLQRSNETLLNGVH